VPLRTAAAARKAAQQSPCHPQAIDGLSKAHDVASRKWVHPALCLTPPPKKAAARELSRAEPAAAGRWHVAIESRRELLLPPEAVGAMQAMGSSGNKGWRDQTAWLGWEDSNSEMSSQIIPLKGRTDSPWDPAEFRPPRLFAFELRRCGDAAPA
jgi:hypothetical protein